MKIVKVDSINTERDSKFTHMIYRPVQLKKELTGNENIISLDESWFSTNWSPLQLGLIKLYPIEKNTLLRLLRYSDQTGFAFRLLDPYLWNSRIEDVFLTGYEIAPLIHDASSIYFVLKNAPNESN